MGSCPSAIGRAGQAKQPRVARKRSKLRDKIANKRGSLGSTEIEQRALVAAEPHVPGALRQLPPVGPRVAGQSVQGVRAVEMRDGPQLPFLLVGDGAKEGGDRRFMRMHERRQTVEARVKCSEWRGEDR